MIDLRTINPLKRQHLTSVLGLTLDGGRLEAVVLRRTNGSLHVQQNLSIALSLDPLTAASELVGQEIRNHLDAAGVRERACIVGLPLKWVLTTHVDIPEMPKHDVPGFLQMEAERGFPCDASTLQVCTSRCRTSGGREYALLAGIPLNHVAALEAVLRAAKLKPVSFVLGITALQPPGEEAAGGVLALTLGEGPVGLQVTSGGGIVALRALEGALDLAGGRKALNSDLIARETRITLGQLPAAVRETVRKVRIFGPRDLGRQLADELELRLDSLGLEIDTAARYGTGELGASLPAETPVSAALSMAARRLVEQPAPYEFLPPKLSAWQQVSVRYSSGKLRLAGAAAAAVLLLTLGSFGYQQWRLTRLQSQWTAMAPKVRELDKLVQQTRQYRAWFDESCNGMTILKQLTLAFPEESSVSAKAVEIRDLSSVTCSGVARDYAALLKTTERLRSAPNVSDVKLENMRGKSPIQFTFSFRWNPGGAR